MKNKYQERIKRKLGSGGNLANISSFVNTPAFGGIMSGVQGVANAFSNTEQRDVGQSKGSKVAENLVTEGTAAAANYIVPGSGELIKMSDQLNKAIEGDGTSGFRNAASSVIGLGGLTNSVGAIADGRWDEAIPIFGGFAKADRIKKEMEEQELKKRRLETDKAEIERMKNIGAEELSMRSKGKNGFKLILNNRINEKI